MSEQELNTRLEMLESGLDALFCVVNRLLEDFYEPEYLKKLDLVVKNGKREGK